MGLCQSEEDKALAKKNRVINRELQDAYFENVKIIKLLLLGKKFRVLKKKIFKKIIFRNRRMWKKYHIKTNEVGSLIFSISRFLFLT